MRNIRFIISALFALLFLACDNPDPNITKEGQDELQAHEIVQKIDNSEIEYQDMIYVPIYSDIYTDPINQSTLLSATLSIRNTSFTDSLFVTKIDYYNTEGELVRAYINNPISISPMGTVNYVIEKDDDTGGPGANFIVALSAKSSNLKPLIQAVMISHTGNKGFAFSTDGYSIL